MSSTAKLSNINFFISSTYIDMREYRDAVIKDLQGRAGIINAQEFFGARDSKPLDTCLDELEKSNVFLLFLGPRYGSIDDVSGKSFVECEYERACELKLLRLAYIIDQNQPFPLKYVSLGADAEYLSDFKRRVQADLTVSSFTTPSDLASKVFSDLSRELPKRDFVLGKESPEKEHASTLKALEEFHLLPKLFHGRTLSFAARIGKPERASAEECDAFGYEFGATVKRSCEPIDSTLRRALRTSFWVFASAELSPRLLELPSGHDIKLTVKTLQGEYTLREPVYGYEREHGLFDSIASQYSGRRRVVIDHTEKTKLICGFEYVEASEL